MTVVGAPGSSSASHVLLVYRREIHRQALVASWVRQGLARGEKVLYSTVPDDTLVPVLRAADRGGAAALRPGQLSLVPAADFFPGARQAELVHRALDEGYPAVRLSARADEALHHESLEEYRAVDHLMHELCATLPVAAVCQLDVGAATPDTVTTLIDSHDGVVEDIAMRLFRREGQVVVSGEVDFSSAEVVAEALRCACMMEAAPSAVVDLSELSFVDVAGCRALFVGTEELRRGGVGVTFRGVRGNVLKVMTLLGMGELARIEAL